MGIVSSFVIGQHYKRLKRPETAIYFDSRRISILTFEIDIQSTLRSGF